jgi:hypothetical protein
MAQRTPLDRGKLRPIHVEGDLHPKATCTLAPRANFISGVPLVDGLEFSAIGILDRATYKEVRCR